MEMQLKQWVLYWEAVFPFKPDKEEMKRAGDRWEVFHCGILASSGVQRRRRGVRALRAGEA